MSVQDHAGTVSRPRGRGAEVFLLFAAPAVILALVGAYLWMSPQTTRLRGEAAQARRQVTEIVNQPVSRLPRTSQAGQFSPGWFHPGAIKPDFDKVDIRVTQEFPYDSYSYVTSDLNPTEMFRGRDLEFNSMTKFFYTDRTLPKRRLSESEMLEINRLYRVIGEDERASSLRWKIFAGLAAAMALLALGARLLVPATSDPAPAP